MLNRNLSSFMCLFNTGLKKGKLKGVVFKLLFILIKYRFITKKFFNIANKSFVPFFVKSKWRRRRVKNWVRYFIRENWSYVSCSKQYACFSYLDNVMFGNLRCLSLFRRKNKMWLNLRYKKFNCRYQFVLRSLFLKIFFTVLKKFNLADFTLTSRKLTMSSTFMRLFFGSRKIGSYDIYGIFAREFFCLNRFYYSFLNNSGFYNSMLMLCYFLLKFKYFLIQKYNLVYYQRLLLRLKLVRAKAKRRFLFLLQKGKKFKKKSYIFKIDYTRYFRGSDSSKVHLKSYDKNFLLLLVGYFINVLSINGNKKKAINMSYSLFYLLKQRQNLNFISAFVNIVKKVKPLLHFRVMYISGKKYNVPVILQRVKGYRISVKWLISSSKLISKRMVVSLLQEFDDTLKGTSSSIKKRNDHHLLAFEGKSYVRFLKFFN